MPRRPRLAAGDHVLNRRVGRLPLFEKPADYAASEKILAEAHARIRIAAYCLSVIRYSSGITMSVNSSASI